MTTWRDEAVSDPVRIGPLGLVLLVLRGAALVLLTHGGLLLLLFLRIFERPLARMSRPVTPSVTRAVCRSAFRVLGVGYSVQGKPMDQHGAVVSNHSSWLDIFALNASQSVYFVSKSEVERWPVIGWLARATGTVFIARDPKAAKIQQDLFETRIRAGHKLLFFPEGTSTDGLRVLPFKSTLFAAFYSHGLEHVMQIQPVSVVYHAPLNRSRRFYGWWGDMSFAEHLFKTLAQPAQGRVEVVYHTPVSVDAFPSRKALALHCEAVIQTSLKDRLGPDYMG
ncbi:MAG: lysophospholipid acyltransferase family protein [Albidovulum sp.]